MSTKCPILAEGEHSAGFQPIFVFVVPGIWDSVGRGRNYTIFRYAHNYCSDQRGNPGRYSGNSLLQTSPVFALWLIRGFDETIPHRGGIYLLLRIWALFLGFVPGSVPLEYQFSNLFAQDFYFFLCRRLT